jgi:hypothetical protein
VTNGEGDHRQRHKGRIRKQGKGRKTFQPRVKLISFLGGRLKIWLKRGKKMKRFKQMDHLLEVFGDAEKVLQEVVDGMSDDEFNESYEYICRMWDIENDIETI